MNKICKECGQPSTPLKDRYEGVTCVVMYWCYNCEQELKEWKDKPQKIGGSDKKAFDNPQVNASWEKARATAKKYNLKERINWED